MHNLNYVRRLVERLKPGERLEVSSQMMDFTVPDPWTPGEWVLEMIVGSAYEFTVRESTCGRKFIFSRLAEPLTDKDGALAYVSADRQDFYHRGLDGLYRRRDDR